MKTRKEYQENRTAYCITGAALGILSSLVVIKIVEIVGLIGIGVAVVLDIIGCYNWARYKGRSVFFCLWGILAPLGFLGLVFLKDNWKRRVESGSS